MRSAAATFVARNGRWLAGGLTLTFASSFGQTFLIALFADHLRTATGLGHAGWGTLYASATLTAALVIGFVGRFADRRPAAVPATVTITGLAGAAALMSAVNAVWMLALAIFLLRLAGQGMAGHVAMTAVARWYRANRGRALAVAALGHPLGEVLLPGIMIALMAAIGWRSTWAGIALVLLVVVVPAVAWLMANERVPLSQGGTDEHRVDGSEGLGGRHWTRPEVLRHPLFWALLPGLMASPLMGTAILFQAQPLLEAKGWALELYALAFPAFALASIGASLAAGFLIDRWGAARLLPFTLLPLASGLGLVAWATAPATLFAYLALLGLTTGAMITVTTALWAELYGTRHLGAIRGLVSAVMVFATALGPGITGVLLDAGVRLETQFAAMAVVAFLLALGFALTARALSAIGPTVGSSVQR